MGQEKESIEIFVSTVSSSVKLGILTGINSFKIKILISHFNFTNTIRKAKIELSNKTSSK